MVSPYSAGTLTLQEAPSFAWRTNGLTMSRASFASAPSFCWPVFSVMLSQPLLQASIHFSPMPNIVNDDFLCLDINAVNDPIISDSYSVQALGAFELECLPWKRLLLQQLEALPHTGNQILREVGEILVD